MCGRVGNSPVTVGDDPSYWVQCEAPRNEGAGEGGWFHTACVRRTLVELAAAGGEWHCWQCQNNSRRAAEAAVLTAWRAERNAAAEERRKASEERRHEREAVAAAMTIPESERVANAAPTPSERLESAIVALYSVTPRAKIAAIYEKKKHVCRQIIANGGKNVYNMHKQ